MENLLHYAWQNRAYLRLRACRDLVGQDLEVLDPGVQNFDSGPDFFNAKVRIGSIIWVGNIEIHQASHQWLEHKHHLDPAYNNVILHVVEWDTLAIKNNFGAELWCCEMDLKQELKELYSKQSLGKKELLPCSFKLGNLDKRFMQQKLQDLQAKRFEEKCSEIKEIWLSEGQDWAKTFWLICLKHFGFGLNNEIMLLLGRSFDLNTLRSLSPKEQEALLLGQAMLLDKSPVSEQEELKTLYQKLKFRFKLEPLAPALFKQMRIRPQNAPIKKLKTFLKLYNNFTPSPQFFANISTISELEQNFKRLISRQHCQHLIINVLAPFLFLWEEIEGCSNKLNTLKLWEALAPENNKITRLFKDEGIEPRHAGDTQAMIYLYKAYCQQKSCFFCPFGRKMLAKSELKAT